jgi:hypothetical protein
MNWINKLLKKKEKEAENIKQDNVNVNAIKVDPELQEKLTRAFLSKRYLICVTRLDPDGKLYHSCTTNDFEKGDIAASLDQWSTILDKELPR